MTNDDVREAFNICVSGGENPDCDTCPYKDIYDYRECFIVLRRHALELINRQKAEIERLKEEVKIHIKKSVAKRKYDRALIESEAIKDFTEGLKEYGRNTLLTNRIIDNFTKVYLKETAGDNDESTL